MPIRAGDLPLESNLHGDVTIKTGDILSNPRKGHKVSFQFKISEGFEVFYAKVKRLADVRAASIGETLPDPTMVYFR